MIAKWKCNVIAIPFIVCIFIAYYHFNNAQKESITQLGQNQQL